MLASTLAAASSLLGKVGLWKPIMSMGSASNSNRTRRSPSCFGSTVLRTGGSSPCGMSPKYFSIRGQAFSGSTSPAMARTQWFGVYYLFLKAWASSRVTEAMSEAQPTTGWL